MLVKVAPGQQHPPCSLDYDYTGARVTLCETDIKLNPFTNLYSKRGRRNLSLSVLLAASPSRKDNVRY